MGKIRPSKLFWATFVGKDEEKYRTIKVGHSLSFQIISNHFGGKQLEKKCEVTKIGHSKKFWTTLVGKDWEKAKMIKIGCSE